MASASRLGRQITEVIAVLEKARVPVALIGGLALAPYGVVRATQDVDLLTDSNSADALDRELSELGYRCVHRSADAANYLRGDERLDLLYASRPVARQLLAAAKPRTTPFGALNVISLEGLIAFKLQGLINDPRRTQDLEDIRALLRANKVTLNRDEVREYFSLFEREALLDELLAEID
jgi:predicted nucleotidyltransferase